MKVEYVDRKGIDRRDVLLSGGSLLVASALMGEALVACNQQAGQRADIRRNI